MRRAISLIIGLLLVAVAGAGVASAQPAEPQPDCEYFDETSHNLCEPFTSYWNANGGLPVFGYPITEAANELNLDLNQEFLTQYFERERMEHHPENAGTPYEVLLGRLGNEVLLEMGRNWFTFPQADPSAEHYFPETGHAIDPAFYEYWSSNGLDLGDEGVSFRESLALFGYPISEAEMETNSSGDTVLTQWFERARFELHGDQVLLGLLGNELLELRDGGEEPPPPPAGEPIAEGLNNPRGLDIGPDGRVYAIDSGIPTENCMELEPPDGGEPAQVCYGYTSRVIAIDPDSGEIETVVAGLPEVNFGDEGGSVQDVVVASDGTVYGIIGLGADPAQRQPTFGDFGNDLGWIFKSDGEGGWEKVVDIAAYESLNNPDEGDPAEGGIDSNPFSLAMDGAGGWVVSDAGGNDLLHVDAEGNISTLAVFPDSMVPAPTFLELPEGTEIPQQSVPTGVVQGPDGAFYVGELTGFPFTPGTARVWRVTLDGEAEVYADGFTAILDIDFDADGHLVVVEMVAAGLLNADPADPATTAARVVKVTEEGEQTVVPSEGLAIATGLVMGADGTAYVSNFGIIPNMGQVVAIPGVGEPAPEGPALTVIAEGLNQPRGLTVDADGNIFVAQVGVGGDSCIIAPSPEGEEAEVCFGLTSTIEMITAEGRSTAVEGLSSIDLGGEGVGAHDVAIGADGQLYIVMGLGADPAARAGFPVEGGDLGWLVRAPVGANGLLVTDIAAYEGMHNPDGGDPAEGGVDSNPFSIVAYGAGWAVSDAGGNDILFLDADGNITNVVVFPDSMVPAPPFLELPEGTEIPQESVPTGMAVGPDGALYVGELTGFPFTPGTARIWRVTADGQAQVYATGLTNVIDVAFDSQGNLYALEVAANSLLSEDPTSAVVRVSTDGEHEVVVGAGLTFATGMAIGPDDTFYVSNFGVMPGMGQVVSFTLD
ncbi:MAG TPA: ScyD/ScyE family protein [Thermomicrobiales bacterium]|nr:ScyD/ScyE family protein [Thermomicrobiales bacterium]